MNPHEAIPMSFSSMSTFQSCPLKWKIEKIDGYREGHTIATLRGVYVHECLESLFGHAPELRTSETALSTADELWLDYVDQFLEIDPEIDLDEMRNICGNMILDLWNTENPQKVNVMATELKISGSIGDAECKGFIDRVDVLDNGNLSLVDYKTGPLKDLRYYTPKLMQLTLYAILLAQDGHNVEEGKFVHLGSGVVCFPITQALQAETIKVLNRTVKSIKKCLIGEQNWTSKTSPLCCWCPHSVNGKCDPGSKFVQTSVSRGKYTDSPAAIALRQNQSN